MIVKVFEEIVLLKTKFHKVDIRQLIKYIVETTKIGSCFPLWLWRVRFHLQPLFN